MAITKAEFKQAFREVVSLEFSHIPTDESSIQYTFSEKFNKRMEKLIKAQKKVYWNLVSTTSKRVAIIFVAIFTMFTAAFSVKAIREPIVNFFTEVYESFTRYLFEGDTADIITKEYSLNTLPDGYKQTNKIQSDISITTIFENDFGDIIEFSQTITTDTEHLLDSEHNKAVEIEVSDKTVHILENYGTTQAVWVYNEYCFKITAYGNMNIDEIKALIESVG